MARPTADSLAAKVRIKSENSWPYTSSKYTEKIEKFIFKLKNITSRHINITKILFLLNDIPSKLTTNKKKLTES